MSNLQIIGDGGFSAIKPNSQVLTPAPQDARLFSPYNLFVVDVKDSSGKIVWEDSRNQGATYHLKIEELGLGIVEYKEITEKSFTFTEFKLGLKYVITVTAVKSGFENSKATYIDFISRDGLVPVAPVVIPPVVVPPVVVPPVDTAIYLTDTSGDRYTDVAGNPFIF